MRQVPWFLWLLAAFVVAASTFRWPYGYYTFTHIVVCAFSATIAYIAWTERSVDGP